MRSSTARHSTAERVVVAAEGSDLKRLGQQISRILVRGHVTAADLAVRHPLAHLQVAALDMAAALAARAVLGQTSAP
eukprot:4365488-Prymnesium_polylepis.1